MSDIAEEDQQEFEQEQEEQEELPIKKKVKTETLSRANDDDDDIPLLSVAKMEEAKKEKEEQKQEEKPEKKQEKEEKPQENGGRNLARQIMEEEQKASENATTIAELHNTEFYDRKQNAGHEGRMYLETILLRSYHNWIKSVLINKYITEIKNYYRANFKGYASISVLDLGCGNGGDLTKWLPNRIAYYVGVDVSKTAVENAHGRWKNLRLKPHERKFQADFISVGGGASEANFFKNINENAYFDIVSSQFVIHYMFSKRRYVENLFNNISKRLVKNGYFICTIPDADVMVKRIRTKGVKNENGELVLGNQHYSIKFKNDKFPKGNPYGLEYGFFLDDGAVGRKETLEDGTVKITYVPEYLIIPENFVKVAKKYKLELVEEKNFHDFCKESIKSENHVRLMRAFKLNDIGDIPKELWEISYLYKVAVFRKTAGKEMNQVERNFNSFSKGEVIFQEDEMEEEGDDFEEEGEIEEVEEIEEKHEKDDKDERDEIADEMAEVFGEEDEEEEEKEKEVKQKKDENRDEGSPEVPDREASQHDNDKNEDKLSEGLFDDF